MSRRRQRSARGHGGRSRTRGGLRERKRVLVAVEGESTEIEYFKWLNARVSSVHLVVKQDHSSPERVVELALRLQAEDERTARSEGAAFDDVWCVVDVDTHIHLVAAVQEAERHGLNVALSGPCFETWLIVHLQEHNRHLDPQEAKKVWAQAGNGRSLESGVLAGRLGDALDRAQRLRRRYERDHVKRTQRNPSTEVDQLLRAVAGLARVRPVDMY